VSDTDRQCNPRLFGDGFVPVMLAHADTVISKSGRSRRSAVNVNKFKDVLGSAVIPALTAFAGAIGAQWAVDAVVDPVRQRVHRLSDARLRRAR
jgi:hypothetical protein